MKTKTAKFADQDKLKEYNTQRIIASQFRPNALNVKLTSNPFLKDQEKFHYIVYRLNDYNRRVNAQQVKDPFESMNYQKLHSITCDLAYIETREDQLVRLQQAFKWWKGQQKLIEQRKDQGYVRYEVTKEVRYGVEVPEKQVNDSQKQVNLNLPSEVLKKQSKPFKRGWRTTHKQLDLPIRRLNEYKRKIINIAPFIEQKDEKKAPKIVYPKIEKIQEPNKQEDEKQEGVENLQNKEGLEGGEEGEQKPQEQQQQQDLGGFGEQPQQPEEQQKNEDEAGDKLAPRFKNYTVEWEDRKRKQYQEPYLFYKGEQIEAERRMEQKYLKIQNEFNKKQNEDNNQIAFMNYRGQGKSKMQKALQKRLQIMTFKPKYSFSEEPQPLTERLNPQEQLKFGFTTNVFNSSRNRQNVDFTSMGLPQIDKKNQTLYEKSIRKDRIKSLKNKFGKMLSIKEYEERQTPNSLCQYTSKKRGISQIIRANSRSKQRLYQLDEVTKIKQKISQGNKGIDIKSLSMGLCAPEDENFSGQNFYPDRDLPSNPFMVEPKKKKKKK